MKHVSKEANRLLFLASKQRQGQPHLVEGLPEVNHKRCVEAARTLVVLELAEVDLYDDGVSVLITQRGREALERVLEEMGEEEFHRWLLEPDW